jgi:hypothetical protein
MRCALPRSQAASTGSHMEWRSRSRKSRERKCEPGEARGDQGRRIRQVFLPNRKGVHVCVWCSSRISNGGAMERGGEQLFGFRMHLLSPPSRAHAHTPPLHVAAQRRGRPIGGVDRPSDPGRRALWKTRVLDEGMGTGRGGACCRPRGPAREEGGPDPALWEGCERCCEPSCCASSRVPPADTLERRVVGSFPFSG